MKLTAFILTCFLFQLYANNGAAQMVSFSGKNVTLTSIIKAVETQTGYKVFGKRELLAKAKLLTVSAQNKPLKEFLDIIFKDERIGYEIRSKTIALFSRPQAQAGPLNNVRAVPQLVAGILRDTTGIPIQGASIRLVPGNKGTSSSADGSFVITNAEPGSYTLEISYIGFETVRRKITIPENSSLDIGTVVMRVSDSPLDEVKVIAYGRSTDRTSIGNISSVSAKEIEQYPVSNPLVALIGRVPGLVITQNGGFAGQALTVRIQGQNSIASGNDPYYVVDGVPFISSNINGQDGAVSISPFSLINPNDIESISVLKDADATAIYGSRAANGAILITTKKGRNGALRVDVKAQHGFSRPGKKLKMMNTEQYLEMRKDAMATVGLTPTAIPGTPGYAQDLTLFDQKRYTDWQDVLLRNDAFYTDINPTISGGTENFSFFLGATYRKETSGFITSNISNQTSGLHFALNAASPNKKFRMGFRGTYVMNDNRLPKIDVSTYAFILAPNAPALYNPDGSVNWNPSPNGTSTWMGLAGVNPVAYLERQAINKNNNLGLNADFSYELIKGLVLSATMGYNAVGGDQVGTFPLSSVQPERRALEERSARFSFNKNLSWIVEPQLHYSTPLSQGTLNLLVGGTIQRSNENGWGVAAYGQVSDELLTGLSAASRTEPGYAVDNRYHYAAGFTRLGYNWKGKYLVSANIRRDGSSKFGPENRFHNFWSTGLGWVFSEENWLKEHLPVLSFAKISVSYGTTGNDQIPNYSFISLYNPIYVGIPYQNGSGLEPNRLSNPYLQWEETSKFNTGLTLAFFHDRLNFSGNYFRNRSSNQLIEFKLPIVTGFGSITNNFPAVVRNSGLEFSFTSQQFAGRQFKWSTNFNITFQKNKLVEFDGKENTPYASSRIGQPLSEAWMYRFAEVNPQDGIYYFYNTGGEKVTADKLDFGKDAIGYDRAPKYTGGITNTFRYKGITLDFTFSFRRQYLQNYRLGIWEAAPGNKNSGNGTVELLDRWRQPGDVTLIGRVSNNGSDVYSNGWRIASLGSDLNFRETFFAKLSNVALVYSIPVRWQQAAKLRDASLFVNASNVLWISNYIGLDPETQSHLLPPLQVISFGLRTGF